MKEVEEKISNQKKEIEEERKNKIEEKRKFYNDKLNDELELLEEQFKIEKDNNEKLNKLECEQIELDLKRIKEKKATFVKEGNSSRIVDNLYDELKRKLSTDKNEIKLKLELNEQKFLKAKGEEKAKELEDKARQIKENIEIYQSEIIKQKTEVENICYQLENEKDELKKKENELNNKKLEIDKRFNIKNLDLEMSQKDIESKEEEETKFEFLQQELDSKLNSLLYEKNKFEMEKNDIIKLIEERNNELKIKNDKVKEEEMKIEQELNKILAEEKEINNQLNKIKYFEDNISFERNNIERERKNLEFYENKIQEDIKILNTDKAKIEEDKERIKNIYLEIDQKNNEINKEYRTLQRESLGIELKAQTIENMRLNHVFNNQNGNTNLNDNFDSIGYSTSPNFGNYINLNLTNNQNMEKRNRDFGQSSEENLLNSVSIFNKGGKRINADEYFQNLKNSLKNKRNIDPNEDMENYLMNGKNYIKDLKEKNQILNESKDN